MDSVEMWLANPHKWEQMAEHRSHVSFTLSEWVFGMSDLDDFVGYPLARNKVYNIDSGLFGFLSIPDTYTDLR